MIKMRKFDKKTLVLIITVINLVFAGSWVKVSIYFSEGTGYWDLTTTPIFIDDSDPNFNWSKTAVENDWCTGLGTWDDPYVIENVFMEASSASQCITIQNSHTYFQIKNCTIKNGKRNSDGIFLNKDLCVEWIEI